MKRLSLILLPALLSAAALLSTSSASAQQPFERGMTTPVTFVPKGQWITGISVNYAAASHDNYQFFIFEGIDGKSYSFKISPMLMFAFKDNLAAGARFAYTRSMVQLDRGSLVLDSETSYDVDHLYSISHNYAMTGAFRNYISLGGSNRFGIFNEVQLQLGGGQSKLSNGTGRNLTGTYQRNFNMNVGVAPGLIMFLSNYSAIEVNVGVLGFSYRHTHAITDQVYEADLKANHANFKVNLFSITFGVAFYL